jgi:hypothetical protein
MPLGQQGVAAYPRSNGNQSITPPKLHPNNRKYGLDRFDRQVLAYTIGANAAAFSSGSTGAINYLQSGPFCHQYFVLGAGQTITAPVIDLTTNLGLNITQDAIATEGASWLFGGPTSGVTTSTDVNARRPLNAFIAQVDKAFFMRVKFISADASGFNPLAFGFRRAQADQTALGSFTDYACLKGVANGTVADISTETRLNSGSVATTLTSPLVTVADNVAREYYVEVNGAGVVKMAIDGAYVPVTFTFDSGDIVQPFGYLIHGADVANGTHIQEVEWGYREPRGF